MRNPRSVSRFFLKYALLLLGVTIISLAAVQVWDEIQRTDRELHQVEVSFLESRKLQLKRTVQMVLHTIRIRRQRALDESGAQLLQLVKEAHQLATRGNSTGWLPVISPPPFACLAVLDRQTGRVLARTGGDFPLPDLSAVLKESAGSSPPAVREIVRNGTRYRVAATFLTPRRACVAVSHERMRTRHLQEDLLREIASMRFGEEGYIFINTFAGIPLIRDGEVVPNGDSIWDLTDSTGVKVIQAEYRAAQQPDGGFIHYHWRRLRSQEIAPKLSYVAGDPEWNWMIGTGVYLDDLKPLLQQRKDASLAALHRKLARTFGLFLVMILAILALSLRFRRKLDRDFRVFTGFFHQAAEKGRPIQPERLVYREFRKLAADANAMLEKQQALLAAREQSEAKFRKLFDRSSDAMSILSSKGFIDCNQALQRMFGADRKEDLLVHPVDLSPTFQPDGSRSDEKAEWMIRHAMETGHHRFEWLHQKLNGENFWCEIMLTRIPWEGEDCLFVVWRDISERKAIELALRESEARLKKSQAMARVGHWELDVDANHYHGSEVLYEIYGYEDSLAPVDAERINQSTAPEDRDRVANELKNLIIRNEPFDTTFRIIRESDRGIRHIHSAAEAVRDASGRCRKVVGVVQDITDLKNLELTALSERERLRTVVDSIAEAVIVTEPDTRIAQMNPVAETLLGTEENDAKGRLLLDVLHLTAMKDDPQESEQAVGGLTFPGRAELLRTDGTRRQVLISSTTFELTPGEVAGLVLAIRDVTELRQMQQELEKTQRLESLGYLAGGIAHDFNNQLTGITATLSLARAELRAGKPIESMLEKAERAALQCRNLTGQLLTFAKGGEPIMAPVDLGELLLECITVATSGKGVQVSKDTPTDLPFVQGDRGQLHQVFTNILINAVQATDGKGQIRVTAETKADDGNDPTVMITIADNGPGIPEDIRSRIFDPFFTTKATGTGLGLSTAHSIVQRHHGQLTVDSKPSQGTAVRITLPVSHERPSMSEPETGSRNVTGLRILVMDDEAIIRELAEELFAFLGHEVTTTADGTQAIERYREAMASRPYDVVFLDITVPGGMGGKETMTVLKELDPKAIGIVMSGYARDPLLADPQAFGFSGRLAKPFKLDEVQAVIAAVTATQPEPTDGDRAP